MSPAPAQAVVIRLPGGEDVAARVDADDGVTVTLVLAVPARDAVAHSRAIVEWTTPTGVHRIAGPLTGSPDDPAVVCLRRQGDEVIQRREWARVGAVVPVDVRLDDGGDLAATVTLDVSGGGALIHDPVGELAIGTPVRMQLHLDGHPITAHGQVVRETSAGAKGVVIDAIAEADRERIIRFVNDRQRAELRLRREPR
jgi:hypothetical protein